MTDRYISLIVALEQDMRSDDAETLISAIKQLRGVLSVSPNVADVSDWVAQERVRSEFRRQIMEILFPPPIK